MERQLCLEFLPLEVLGHIASFLSVQDIIACCSTSSVMRQAFNDDLVWKKHCNLVVSDYLKKNECLVEPSFEWLEDEQSTLQPVSAWRKCYMMQVHLFKNWRHGKYEKESIEFGQGNEIFTETGVVYYESDYLFLHTVSGQTGEIDEIWDVKGTPFLHSILNFDFNRLTNDAMNTFDRFNVYKIVNNKLVVGRFNMVLIYDITLPSLSRIPLDHAFIFDTSEKISKDVITCDADTVCQNTYFEMLCEVEQVVCRNFFIGTVTPKEASSNPILHIWDIETGKKIKEESVLTRNVVIKGFQLLSSQNEQDVIVKLHVNKDRYMYHYYGYSLVKMDYSSFSVKLNYCDFVILVRNCVVGVGPKTLFLYNYKTSEKMLVRRSHIHILKKSLTVLGNDLLFGTFDNTVHVMNLLTLDIINSVKLGFTLYSLRGICDKFVIINSTDSEVWEIGKTAKKLFRFSNIGSFAAVNQTCTKLALERANKLIVLNFW